ncbi:Hypothetical_protein [Hexamita inflata]|uniref:Hypothetical_protein n=1 Tax=Hexamita inflata TaxID=28002 RepID=A0ABP1HIU7_9EUKA
MLVLMFAVRKSGLYLYSCSLTKISEYLLSLSFEVEYGFAQNTRQTQSYMILKYKVILKQIFSPKNSFGRLLLKTIPKRAGFIGLKTLNNTLPLKNKRLSSMVYRNLLLVGMYLAYANYHRSQSYLENDLTLFRVGSMFFYFSY